MDSNRVRLSTIREATLGVTPSNPTRMRTARITQESLGYTPIFFTPGEIRADRMSADPTKINETNRGGIGWELTYPVDGSPLSDLYQSAFFNGWVNTATRDNDGATTQAGATAYANNAAVALNAIIIANGAYYRCTTAGTTATAPSTGPSGIGTGLTDGGAAFSFISFLEQISNVTAAAQTVAVRAGTAYVIGHLVRHTGFGQAANNGLFRVSTGGATSYISIGSGLVNETPPGAARSKVVGFQGAPGDITATATGLSSTVLDFTTLGLTVGQWLKVGGTGAAFRFINTPACNDWIRITAIAANAITADNLPVGWGPDAGTGRTLRVFFGDYLRNGTNRTSLTIERSFLSQATPTHIVQRGMVVNRLMQDISSGAAVTGSVEFMGLTGAQSTTALGTSYDAATTGQVMTANVSVGRIAEAGQAIASPNWCRSLKLTLDNNLRMIEAVGQVGAVEIGVGEFGLTGTIDTYFGSNALLTKLFAGTITNINARAAINNQAIVWTLPRVTFGDGSPNAAGKNQDVILSLPFITSFDAATNCEGQFERFEYFET